MDRRRQATRGHGGCNRLAPLRPDAKAPAPPARSGGAAGWLPSSSSLARYGTLAATTRLAEPAVGDPFQRRGPNCANMIAEMATMRNQKCERVDMIFELGSDPCTQQ